MRKQRSAFTLVELLVVLGIIAVLISVLMPALRRAKEVATRAVCLSNHKSLTQALYLYAQDFKGKLPEPNWDNGAYSPNRLRQGWLYDCTANAIDQVNGRKIVNVSKFDWADTTMNSPRSGAFWKYIRSENIYRCPFDIPPWLGGFGAQNTVHQVSSYGLNGAIVAFGAAGSPYRLEDFKPNEILIWELDETYNQRAGGTDIYNDAANYPAEGLTPRHGSGASGKTAGGIVSTVSGSVEWITQYDFSKEANKPAGNPTTGRSRLWCIPRKYSRDGHSIP